MQTSFLSAACLADSSNYIITMILRFPARGHQLLIPVQHYKRHLEASYRKTKRIRKYDNCWQAVSMVDMSKEFFL